MSGANLMTTKSDKTDKVVGGVDLTGTKENPTEAWLVVGRISNLGLEIIEVKKTGSHLLARDLASYKTIEALGVNCPLSLPQKFLDFLAQRKLKKNYEEWHQVVEDLVFTPYDEFLTIAKEFAKEPKRITDTAGGATAASPLKRGNPPMLHLTHHAIRFLATLDPARYFVRPMQDPIAFGCAVMEVCPQSTMNFLKLQDISYESKDKGEQSRDKDELRREKLVHNLSKIKERKALTFKDFPSLIINQRNLMHNFLHSDKAVEALLACYATSVYAVSPEHFEDPFAADALEVLTEGWTYRLKNL